MRSADFGKIEGTVYKTSRKYPEHFFFKNKSLNISQDVIEDLKRRKISLIEMRYLNEDGREETLIVPRQKYETGEVYDNDGDIQRSVPLKELREITKDLL